MDNNRIDLYEFLTESELQHYYNSIKTELKISNVSQFKYATDDDLKQIGLSRPEIRRLRKYYEKFYPHGYLGKIKRLLQAPTTIVKREDGSPTLSLSSTTSSDAHSTTKTSSSPGKTPNNKHIIPADSISVNKQLGTGEFGIVQQGVWTNGSERIQVAIKCLCRERMQSNPMEFLKEAAIMHSIEHENIVRLYGVVLSTDSLMLVTELAHLRSLLECLKDSALRISFLTISTLCEFALQICNGMKYLENKRLIHRDLAARNILVFSKNKVKISDFGLSRALGVGKDYYKTNFNVNLKLPIAWCAPECINYLRFTNASDVWAYGVCLWEMFSYGFQPWAALTGLQILEAIDAPNFQRLEQPECCPREYYQLMMKCWQDDPLKRPKFNEICEILPEIKPEQLKAVFNYCEPKRDYLLYGQGDIITVLDRSTNTGFWKGALNSGKTGLFNPANTVAYLESLPSSNRNSFCRTSERYSKKKLRTEMISKPQNDLKHTGHIGIDGDTFGDVSFMANSHNYNHLPRQIVTPYKPSEDIEQTPLLLPPTPTSPDSLQTASSYFPDEVQTSLTNPNFVPSTENTPKQFSGFDKTSFDFSHQEQDVNPNTFSTNPFANSLPNQSKPKPTTGMIAMQNNNYDLESNAFNKFKNVSNTLEAESEATSSSNSKRSAHTTLCKSSLENPAEPHEYHEISDDDVAGDKFDFGPSLLDEINLMFGSMSSNVIGFNQSKSPDLEHINKSNETSEYASKLNRKSTSGEFNGNKTGTSKKKGSCTVKPISVKDEKILNHAIEIANEISARSMTDLVCEQSSTQSPKRKFSFRFPHLSSSDKSNASGYTGASGSAHNSNSGTNGGLGNTSSYPKEKKNFTEELKSIPDLQTLIGEEGREAYKNLIERRTADLGNGIISPATSLLNQLEANNFELTSSKTFPRRSTLLRLDEGAKTLTASENIVLASSNVSIPHQNAPRPMTLPTRGPAARLKKSDISINNITQHPETNDLESNVDCHILTNEANKDEDSICESPSYLPNTRYSFPEGNKSAELQLEQSNTSTDSNPIPLPPRTGKQHIKCNPKRHVRKYPLIIPAYGVQRTLNKVTEMTVADDDEPADVIQKEAMINRNQSQLPSGKAKAGNISNPSRFTLEVVAAVRPTARDTATYENTSNFSKEKPEVRTYLNVADSQKSNENEISLTTDSASLQFESILEDDFNKINVLQSPDVTDGFYNFSIQKEHVPKTHNADESDLDNDATILATGKASLPENAGVKSATCGEGSSKITKLKLPNELAGHALFMKVRESVDLAMSDKSSTGANRSSTQRSANINRSELNDSATQITSSTKTENTQSEADSFARPVKPFSNSVSCEDLLEFSDRKPKGCERGVDSDEVRIMTKVLGTNVAPNRCLRVLDFLNWDVHKAIKLIKLQTILNSPELSLTESVDTLQNFDWDLQVAATKIKNIK